MLRKVHAALKRGFSNPHDLADRTIPDLPDPFSPLRPHRFNNSCSLRWLRNAVHNHPQRLYVAPEAIRRAGMDLEDRCKVGNGHPTRRGQSRRRKRSLVSPYPSNCIFSCFLNCFHRVLAHSQPSRFTCFPIPAPMPNPIVFSGILIGEIGKRDDLFPPLRPHRWRKHRPGGNGGW
jgi:hypothetical protein